MAFSFVCIVAVFLHACYGAVLEKDEHCLTKLSEIHHVTDLDMHKFSGAWYAHSMTDYVFPEQKWDSATYMIYVNGDKDISIVVSGHQEGRDECRTMVLHLHKQDVGVYSGPFYYSDETTFDGSEKIFLFEVLYVNEAHTTAAVFMCANAKDDGTTCEHKWEELELWSRHPEDLTPDEEKDLEDHIENIDCVDKNDLRHITQGECAPASSVDDHSDTHVCEGPSTGHTETAVTCRCNPRDNETAFVPETRPKGVWQSVIVAIHEGETATGSSYKFIPGADSNTLYVLRSHQSGHTCSEGTVDEYQRLTEHHYVQMFASVPKEIWVFETPSHQLVVFTCDERYKGSCKKGHSHVEMLAEIGDDGPVDMHLLETFKTRLDSKFCTHFEYYTDQKAGVCAPSNIQGKIVALNDMLHHSETPTFPKATLVKKQSCKLADIPLQESFEMSQLAGLWYEIAKPHSSAKSFESGAEYYELKDDNTMHSTYSGAEDNRCTPAIGAHIRHSPKSEKNGDLEMTLHGPHGPLGIFDWVPVKMVYNDGEYMLYYDCYYQYPEGVCVRGKPTIMGRRPTIDDYTKQKIYAMLSSLCVSADDMEETVHNTDCTEWAIQHHADDTEHHHCHVYEIPNQNKVSMDKMVGTWYVVASHNSDTNVLEIRRDGTSFVADAYEKHDGKCSKVMTEVFTQHDAEHNGDFLLSQLGAHVSPYSSLKIVYTDYNVGVFYICSEENTDGDCTEHGTRTFIMSRQEAVPDLKLSTLKSQLKLPCEDLSEMHEVHDHCHPHHECHVSEIPVVEHLNKLKLAGIWYDIEHSSSELNAGSGVFNFSVDNHGHIHVKYSGVGSDGACIDPKTADMRQHHDDIVDGDMLSRRLASEPSWGFFTFKIMYTDDHALVIYVCINVNNNDECLDKRGRILSRTTTMTDEDKKKMMHYFELACIAPGDVVETTHEVDCTGKLH